MRILLVSTLKRKVAAEEFASRSRIIYQLGEGLAKRGHAVSLLGTGDSAIPGVTTIPVIPQGWVDAPPVENSVIRDTTTLVQQARMMVDLQDNFDVIHNHTYPDIFPHVVDRELRIPLVSTLHAVAADYLDEGMSICTNSYFVALSEAYTRLLSKTKPYRVVYNGVDTNLYTYHEQKEEYLLWIGRVNGAKHANGEYMDPKGVGYAIQLAEQTGSQLRMVGPVLDKKAFDAEVAPHLNDKVQWVGEVSPEQSVPTEALVHLFQKAKAFLMTVNQEEPFGLVMTEAMSCGTPVIGWERGAVPEVVVDGLTGFVVDPVTGIEGLKEALGKIETIRPIDCRKRVEEHFSIDRMVRNYEKLYEDLIADFNNKR